MKIIDLTHRIAPEMPLFPGTDKPDLSPVHTYEKNGFRETRITMTSHTGTHMDAPAHLFPEGLSLDQIPVSQFVGTALVIDCSDRQAGQLITLDHLRKYADQVEQAEFILFRTGWDQYWGTPAYFGDYPLLDDAVVSLVISSHKKGVGFDVMSPDALSDPDIKRHKALLRHNLVIIENLKNLHLLGADLFTLFALPLKTIDADGSPIRAIAVLPEKER